MHFVIEETLKDWGHLKELIAFSKGKKTKHCFLDIWESVISTIILLTLFLQLKDRWKKHILMRRVLDLTKLSDWYAPSPCILKILCFIFFYE